MGTLAINTHQSESFSKPIYGGNSAASIDYLHEAPYRAFGGERRYSIAVAGIVVDVEQGTDGADTEELHLGEVNDQWCSCCSCCQEALQRDGEEMGGGGVDFAAHTYHCFGAACFDA